MKVNSKATIRTVVRRVTHTIQCKLDSQKTLLYFTSLLTCFFLSCFAISRSSTLYLHCLPIKWKISENTYYYLQSKYVDSLHSFYCSHLLHCFSLVYVRSQLANRFLFSKLFLRIPATEHVFFSSKEHVLIQLFTFSDLLIENSTVPGQYLMKRVDLKPLGNEFS